MNYGDVWSTESGLSAYDLQREGYTSCAFVFLKNQEAQQKAIKAISSCEDFKAVCLENVMR